MKNNFLGWDFDEVAFSSNLTLLVGVSGAGKTQVIRSIKDLRSICQGVSINGLDWKITFASQTDIYIWQGLFSTVDADDLYHFEADISYTQQVFFETQHLSGKPLCTKHLRIFSLF